MGKRKPVTIGKHHFEKQGDAKAFYKSILWKYKVGDTLETDDSNDVVDLLARHCDYAKKVGPGIKRMIVMLSEEGSRCFGIERTDGARVGFSYHRCVTLRWD